MVKNHQVNEELELELEIEFETLGNILGDYLIFLELKAIASIKDTSYTLQTKQLFDYYAKQFDKLLDQHKDSITRDIRKLTVTLLRDWEKHITTPAN